jgi:hypothetical protein
MRCIYVKALFAKFERYHLSIMRTAIKKEILLKASAQKKDLVSTYCVTFVEGRKVLSSLRKREIKEQSLHGFLNPSERNVRLMNNELEIKDIEGCALKKRIVDFNDMENDSCFNDERVTEIFLISRA